MLGPATNLTCVVVTRLAIITEPDGIHVDRMQCCQHAIHLVVNGRAFGVVHFWHCRVPEDSALKMLHHVEHRANDLVVIAERNRLWNRDVGIPERIQNPVFTINRMRGSQQFTRWFSPQYVVLVACA